MKVDTLFILWKRGYPDMDGVDRESLQGALLLLEKYTRSGNANRVFLFQITETTVIHGPQRALSGANAGEGVGIYLIGHHGRDVAGLGGLSGDVVAARIGEAFDQSKDRYFASFSTDVIRKICVMSCSMSQGIKSASKAAKMGPHDRGHYNEHFLVQLARALKNNGHRPMIAAYENFVTICGPNHPLDVDLLRNPDNTGKKSTGAGDRFELQKARIPRKQKAYKKAFQINEGGYLASVVLDDGWSDKSE